MSDDGCVRCGATEVPLCWSSRSGFKRRVCVSASQCRQRRQRGVTADLTPEVGIRVLGLVTGNPSPFDGQWLAEYDPTRPGVDPNGRPIRAHLVCTSDPAQAMRFSSPVAAHRLWRTNAGSRRPDGRHDRPLTAFHVAIEPIDAPPESSPRGDNP